MLNENGLQWLLPTVCRPNTPQLLFIYEDGILTAVETYLVLWLLSRYIIPMTLRCVMLKRLNSLLSVVLL